MKRTRRTWTAIFVALIVCLIGWLTLTGTGQDLRTADHIFNGPDEELLQLLRKQHNPDVIASRRMLEELERRRKCQQPEDDPKKRQYHALADRLESAKWSEQDPCFQLHPLKPSNRDSGP